MGLHVLLINPKHKTHITFFLLAMILAFLTFGCISFQLFEKEEQLLFFYKHGTSLSVFITPLAVALALQLSKIIHLKKLHYVFIFLPALVMAVNTSLTSPFVSFIRYQNSWRLFEKFARTIFIYILLSLAFLH